MAERRSRWQGAPFAGGCRRIRARGLWVRSAKVMDYEGTKRLLQHADEKFPRLKHS